MKKILKTILLSLTLLIIVGCSVLDNTKKMLEPSVPREYTNLSVIFVTTQGDIEFYLYPEAAPITVANFINLAKRGYYDNNKIFREVQNFVLQTGDPTGTGQGNPGYTIPDEIVNWLNFYQPGMLAMANAGPQTGGSQFFFTLYPADWLNNYHTIFGEIKTDKDFDKLRKLEFGDVIKEIKFTGNVDKYMSLYKPYIIQSNQILDAKFDNLRTYDIPDATEADVEAYKKEIESIYKKDEEKAKTEFESPVVKAIRSIFNGAGKYQPKEVIVNQ